MPTDRSPRFTDPEFWKWYAKEERRIRRWLHWSIALSALALFCALVSLVARYYAN
jgi:hypothetical protein